MILFVLRSRILERMVDVSQGKLILWVSLQIGLGRALDDSLVQRTETYQGMKDGGLLVGSLDDHLLPENGSKRASDLRCCEVDKEMETMSLVPSYSRTGE